MGKEKKARKCPSCGGNGKCERCKGTGRDPDYDKYAIKAYPDCRRCGGNGVCVGCKGRGVVSDN